MELNHCCHIAPQATEHEELTGSKDMEKGPGMVKHRLTDIHHTARLPCLVYLKCFLLKTSLSCLKHNLNDQKDETLMNIRLQSPYCKCILRFP